MFADWRQGRADARAGGAKENGDTSNSGATQGQKDKEGTSAEGTSSGEAAGDAPPKLDVDELLVSLKETQRKLDRFDELGKQLVSGLKHLG